MQFASLRLALAFLLGLLSVGIPFWMLPYSEVIVPNAFLGTGLMVVFMLAFLLRFGAMASFLQAANVMALTFPLALMLRVGVEMLQDPSRHSAWLLMLTVVLCMGYLTALAGAGLGKLVRWLSDYETVWFERKDRS